jgi:hypothetical protein
MPGYTIQGRLKDTQNFLFTLNCEVNTTVAFVDCGDPTNYYGFSYGLVWCRCPPGDLSGEALAVIEGDNVPIGLSNPFMAIYGPYLIDFKIQFLSARSIAETGTIYDMVFFEEECREDCLFRAEDGQYGYLVAGAQAGSPVDAANVWYTEDKADNWTVTSENPFGAGVDLTSVVKIGTVQDHRIVVARGLVAGAPAQIAYADVTSIGQTSWVNVGVGSINGQYITDLAWPNFRNLFAITNDGYIYRSRDGGLTWAIVYQHATSVVFDEISAIKSGYIWVVGDDELLLHSSDMGDAWSAINTPTDSGVDYNTVHVMPDRKVFIGADDGIVYGTLDEGDNWSTFAQQGVTATNVVRVRGFNTHFLWSIVDLADGSSRVLRSTDGGASWRIWDLALNINPNNGLDAMAVVDENRVVVGGAPYPWVGGTAFLSRTETELDRIT